MTYCEVIRKRLPRGDWTLGDHYGSIHMIGTILVDAVEVQAGGLVPEGILYIDDNAIALGGYNGGDGPLPVDPYDRPCLETIWVGIDPGYIEIISYGLGQSG